MTDSTLIKAYNIISGKTVTTVTEIPDSALMLLSGIGEAALKKALRGYDIVVSRKTYGEVGMRHDTTKSGARYAKREFIKNVSQV